MNIAKIGLNKTESFIPREIKLDTARQNADKTEQNQLLKLSNWQEEILISAMDKLVNNIQLDNSHPLGRAENRPIESFSAAMGVLSEINTDSLRDFGSKAQANVSAATFLQLVMEQ